MAGPSSLQDSGKLKLEVKIQYLEFLLPPNGVSVSKLSLHLQRQKTQLMGTCLVRRLPHRLNTKKRDFKFAEIQPITTARILNTQKKSLTKNL